MTLPESHQSSDPAVPAAIPPAGPTLAVTYTFTAADFAEFFDLCDRSASAIDPAYKAARKTLHFNLAVSITATLALAAGFAFNALGLAEIDRGLPFGLMFCALVVGCWWSVHQAWIPLSAKGQAAARESYINESVRNFSEPITFAIEPGGVRVITAQTDTLTRWTAIHDVTIIPAGLLIEYDPGRPMRIPRHAFASRPTFEEFSEAARAYFTAAGSTPEDRLRRHLAYYDVPCPNCRYNLRGGTVRTCPECGHDILHVLDDTRWK